METLGADVTELDTGEDTTELETDDELELDTDFAWLEETDNIGMDETTSLAMLTAVFLVTVELAMELGTGLGEF